MGKVSGKIPLVAVLDYFCSQQAHHLVKGLRASAGLRDDKQKTTQSLAVEGCLALVQLHFRHTAKLCLWCESKKIRSGSKLKHIPKRL